jgi:hypothetical protein
MSDAYRDDLDAARARVSGLEREAERLRKRNAELEARDHAPVVEPPAPLPEVSATARFMTSATRVCLAISLLAATGPRFQHAPYSPHWGVAGISLGLAFLFWWGSGFQRFWRRKT